LKAKSMTRLKSDATAFLLKKYSSSKG
jgi:hypothetical protein